MQVCIIHNFFACIAFCFSWVNEGGREERTKIPAVWGGLA